MKELMQKILSALHTFYCSKGIENIQAMELAHSGVDAISYIARDDISQDRFNQWCQWVIDSHNNLSEHLLKDNICWGNCLKNCSKVWPCLPSKELSMQDRERYYTGQLHYYFDYIRNDGYYVECAIEHASGIYDDLIQLGCMEIYDFRKLREFLDSTFPKTQVEEAAKLYNYVKDRFLAYVEKMVSFPLMSSSEIRHLINDGLFNPVELSRIIPMEIINKCLDEDYRFLRLDYAALPQSDGIDVYFLGAPMTGKSCLISAVLSAARRTPMASILRNPYAYELINVHDEGLTTAPTPYDTAIPIKISIKNKRSNQCLNLIEVDGQSIMNIAASDSFDIGVDLKVGKLLANDNPKILFFIIEPRNRQYAWREKSESLCLNHHQILNALITKLERNDDIMQNVISIHVIVTKNDTISQDTSIDEIIDYNLYRSVIDNINELCRRYKINGKHDYKPKIIPFSIGKLYTPEYFVPEIKYSQDILEVILESMPKSVFRRMWDRIRRL